MPCIQCPVKEQLYMQKCIDAKVYSNSIDIDHIRSDIMVSGNVVIKVLASMRMAALELNQLAHYQTGVTKLLVLPEKLSVL